MKIEIKLLAFAAILGFLLLPGCTKNVLDGNRGKEIRFATVSNGPSTKTAYGAVANNRQALDWVGDEIIRIASPTAHVTDKPNLFYADYKVTPMSDASKGTLTNVANNGLAWGDEAGAYTFYAIYPSTLTNASITLDGSNGEVTAELPVAPALAAEASSKEVTDGDATYTYAVYEPDMTYAYMTAATQYSLEASAFDAHKYVTPLGDGGPEVDLVFNPAFTAFEINLTSADEDFEVSALKLYAEANGSDFLAGEFSMTAGDLTTVAPAGDASRDITITPAKALELTPESGFTVTLFAIPKTNTGVLSLEVTTDKGPATLRLYKADGTTAYPFEAGKKYRINLLRLGGRYTYAIELDPMVLPWTGKEEESSFSENIQAKAFSFLEGALEETDEWRDSEGTRLNELAKGVGAGPSSNHYEAFDTVESSFYDYETYIVMSTEAKSNYLAAHPNYYELYYQQRHMLVKNVNDPHFVITFTPMAPLAGYWTLKPESVGNQGGVEGFQFKIQDGEQWQTSGWNSGQIMGVPVTIGIWPAPDSDPGMEYAMIIKAVFSTDKNGETSYNADTEMQDVHGDGRYSYWKFILPARE